MRARCRRSAMAAAEPSSRSIQLFGRATIPTPCLGPIEAQSLACCPAFRRTSSDAQTQRPPSTPSVDRARHRPYRPQLRPKPSLGELLLPSAPSPANGAAGLAGFRRTASSPPPKGHIATPSFFPGCFV
jgi:hypothetical protein